MKKVLLVTILLAGCGGISQLSPDGQQLVESQLPAIETGTGQLCIFRASYLAGMGAGCDLYANEQKIGRLPNSSYFCANLTPGEYTINAKCFGGARMGAETIIKSGERKYMELSVASSTLMGQTRDTGLSGIHAAM
jgi:hypothetical protein